jgi:ketosteroid isomerase-like protein
LGNIGGKITKPVQLLIVALTFIIFSYSQAYSAVSGTDKGKGAVEEQIWASEEAYFTNLYKGDYEATLALAHSQFLGWPSTLSKPIDKDESASFMKQLISKPTSCTFKIEREGIRVLGEVALTQYIIRVNCSDTSAVSKTQSSRITHTWVKEGDSWRLLGGMSYDQ